MNVYGAAGLRINNAALFGTQAQAWTNNTFTNRAWNVNQVIPNPDVLHLALGVNDFLIGSRTSAQIVTDLTTIRNIYPNADVILYGQYQPSAVAQATWAAHIQALYQLAVTLDCPLVDLYQRSGGYTAANTNGMMGDTTHPNAAAQADWGSLATNLILKAA
jgi:lysophospholipase L1-like esterase